jgi:hypothetical protein
MSSQPKCTCPKTVRGHLSQCPILQAFRLLVETKLAPHFGIEEAK